MHKRRFLRGKVMENIYDRLRELLEEYKQRKEDTYDEGTYWAYDKVIDDLESIILYYE